MNPILLLEPLKSRRDGKTSSSVVLRHAILRAGKQKVEHLNKVSSLCSYDHQFRKEELGSVGELSQVCSQIVLKCLYLARIARLDILCLSGLRPTIGKIDFISGNIVLWAMQHCRLGFFQDSDFAGDLEDSKSTSGGVLCFLEVEHFCLSVGCTRSKQQYPTVLQSLKSFRWMLDCKWISTRSRLLGRGNWGVTFDKQHWKTSQTSSRELVRDKKPFEQQNQDQTPTNWKEQLRCWSSVKCGLRTLKHTFFSRRVSVVHFWRQQSFPSRWSSKDEVQQWDTFPEPTDLRLIGCSIDLTWTQKSKSSSLTSKTNSQTYWPKGNFTRDEWKKSSSFVQYHESLDVLLQPFQPFSFWSDRKAERHVKERSRSDFQWMFTDGETEANDSGEGETHQSAVTQPVECDGKSSAGFGTSGRPRECRRRARQSN